MLIVVEEAEIELTGRAVNEINFRMNPGGVVFREIAKA